MVLEQSLWLNHQQVQPSQRWVPHSYKHIIALRGFLKSVICVKMCRNVIHCKICIGIDSSLFFMLYSQLDTLSKDDLIKFAKKQMAAMQKFKGRCAGSYKCYKSLCLCLTLVYKYVTSFPFSDLEKEVESLKQQSKNNNSRSDDSTLIQVCL